MDIREILTQWAAYQDNIRQFRNGPNAYDIPYFIAQFRELAVFLQEKESFLREWMMEYLRAHRQTIFIRPTNISNRHLLAFKVIKGIHKA